MGEETMGTAIKARERRLFRPVDVYRSDFLQDSGTPLQWLLAWEVVGEREYAEAMARLAVFVAAVTGWPLVSILTAAAMIGAEAAETIQATAPRAPKRFIESQLSPVVQAFGH